MNATPIKVLVIDDEPPIRKLLRMGLSTQGYDILEASNGKIALEKLAESPALIILDLGLPDIQGHELLRMIRGRNESVPISAKEYDRVIKAAERDHIFELVRRAPDTIDQPSARILSRREGGRENDLLTSYSTTNHDSGRILLQSAHPTLPKLREFIHLGTVAHSLPIIAIYIIR